MQWNNVMKTKSLFLILPWCLWSSLVSVIPFDPDLDTFTGLPKTNQSKLETGKIDQVHQKTFAYEKNNAGKIQELTANRNPKNYSDVKVLSKGTSRAVQPWTDWNTANKSAGRILRHNLFYEVMGMTEGEFQTLQNNKNFNTFFPILSSRKERWGGSRILKSRLGKDSPQIESILQAFPGREALLSSSFELRTVNSFRTELKDNPPTSTKPGQFRVLDGYEIAKTEGLSEALKQTDILYLQANNPGAAFQIASNLNCLEGGMGGDKSTMGPNKDQQPRLEDMQLMAVQGENASLGTMGATILRKYAYHAKQPINLLENLENKNILTVNKNGKINSITRALNDKDIPDIMIGTHKNVKVTSGYYPPVTYGKIPQEKSYQDQAQFLLINGIVAKQKNGNLRDPFYVFNKTMDPKQEVRIDQIFTAAIDLNTTRKIQSAVIKKLTKTEAETTARVLLQAQYEGTILAAALNGAKKLFLTFVGGGSFGNKISWILDALDNPTIVEAVALSGLEVILVVYPNKLIKNPKYTEYKKDTAEIYTTVKKLNQDLQNLQSSGPKPQPYAIEKLAAGLDSVAKA